MQEEVENRTVNLAISTTKLTGRTIIAGIRKYLQHREKVKMKKARDPAVHGKQSVKQLLGQNQGATNVEIDKESIRDFEKLAKKYGVDFAVWFAWNMGCPLLHRSRIGSARKELFIPRSVPSVTNYVMRLMRC